MDIEGGDLIDTLREMIQFLEHSCSEGQFPVGMAETKERLLTRAKDVLSRLVKRYGEMSIPVETSLEPYLDMNAGSKGLIATKERPVEVEEYIATDCTDQEKHDYYESFQECNTPVQPHLGKRSTSTTPITSIASDSELIENDPTMESVLLTIYSSMPAAQTKDKSYKCGPLLKKEGRKLFVFEQYRTCWIGLVGSHLLIYASDRDNRPYVVRPIRGYMARPAPSAIPRDPKRSECAFEIFRPGSRTLQLIARTPKDMEEWVTSISMSNGCPDEERIVTSVAVNPICANEKIKETESSSQSSNQSGRKVPVADGNIKTDTSISCSLVEHDIKCEKEVLLNGGANIPPPLPARISRRLPSVPTTQTLSSFSALPNKNADNTTNVEDREVQDKKEKILGKDSDNEEKQVLREPGEKQEESEQKKKQEQGKEQKEEQKQEQQQEQEQDQNYEQTGEGDDEEDDIYHKIDDFRESTAYQNINTSNSGHVDGIKSVELSMPNYDDVRTATKHSRMGSEPSCDQEKQELEGLRKDQKNTFTGNVMAYDDISIVANRPNIESQEQQEKIVSYDDVESLLTAGVRLAALKDRPTNNVTETEAEIKTKSKIKTKIETKIETEIEIETETDPVAKSPQKKSFLDRVRSRRESPRKNEKKVKRKTCVSPRPPSPSVTANELPEYNLPPPPRPVYTKPTTDLLDGSVVQEIYDDVSACQEKYSNIGVFTENLSVNQQIQHTSSYHPTDNRQHDSEQKDTSHEESPVNDTGEHYQMPRKSVHAYIATEEELYDDIALLAEFTAKHKSSLVRKDNNEDAKSPESPEKKPWNRLVAGRKSKFNDSSRAETNENVYSGVGVTVLEKLNDHQSFGRMNTFQRLISKMECSLGKPSSKTIPHSTVMRANNVSDST